MSTYMPCRTSEIILEIRKNRHEMAEAIWTSAATLDMRCLPDDSITQDVRSIQIITEQPAWDVDKTS
jgi:hypothetical protein